jgi:catechol 2,3-dioxygenase-like lactoylglutathione lyase family enzyme
VDQRISFITLAVRDLGAARTFYVDGLGWEPCFHQAGEVLMFEVGAKLILSLWDVDAFAAEVGQAPGGGVPPITIAHNLATPDGVDRVLEQARNAGAAQVTGAVQRDWGGYSGYFVDPDGFRWEICHNPGEIGAKVLP